MTNPYELIINRLQAIEDHILEIKNSKTTECSDYSKKDAAKLLDKSTSWIDSMRRKGEINFFMRGGEVRIPASELARFQYQQEAV